MQLYSLKERNCFSTDYWPALVEAWAEVECVVLFASAPATLRLHCMETEADAVICRPTAFCDKKANSALHVLTSYGCPFKVVFVTRRLHCFNLLEASYEVEKNLCPIGQSLITDAAPFLMGASKLEICKDKYLWCFSYDADGAITLIPETLK